MKLASRPGILKGRQSDPELILCAVFSRPQTSWRVDETTVRAKGRWCYLYCYRAIDAAGTTIDFMLSEVPDAAAATRLFRTALPDSSATESGHPPVGRGGRRRRRAVEATHRAAAAL